MDGTFSAARPLWLDRIDRVRNVVRQELIGRQLDRHLGPSPAAILDVGAGQGTQSLRLARAGHTVTAIEPDAAMRSAFAAALDDEPSEVQERVVLRDGSVDSLEPLSDPLPGPVDRMRPGRFDAVLLLGVLMYLPDPFATVAALADRVAPGGLLSLAVRTTTSAVWRPVARQDWLAAREAIAEHDRASNEGRDMNYINEIGAPARAQDLPALLAVAVEQGLELERWYGIRVAVDSAELDPPPPSDREELAAMLEVEEYLASTDPFRQLGQLAHLILRRSGQDHAG